MSAVTVSVTKPKPYDIIIENGLLKHSGDIIRAVTKGQNCLVVTDSNVAPLYLDVVVESLQNSGINTILMFLRPVKKIKH